MGRGGAPRAGRPLRDRLPRGDPPRRRALRPARRFFAEETMHGDGAAFPGARVTPRDPRYPTLVRGFNQRWVGHPRFVQVVGDARQVVEVAQHCVEEKLRLTVRSGGHCYGGWVSENDGGIVDVSSLHSAGWDEANGWYYLDSGCTNWDLYNQLYRQYGVTLPAGSCYSVGAGGHICG